MAEPAMIGLGLIIDATTSDPAAKQCAINLISGRLQQSMTTRVIFFVNNKGFVKLVILIPFLIKFNTCPHGKKQEDTPDKI